MYLKISWLSDDFFPKNQLIKKIYFWSSNKEQSKVRQPWPTIYKLLVPHPTSVARLLNNIKLLVPIRLLCTEYFKYFKAFFLTFFECVQDWKCFIWSFLLELIFVILFSFTGNVVVNDKVVLKMGGKSWFWSFRATFNRISVKIG